MARATTLSDLLVPGGSIQVGDLVFDNFSYLQTGDMPAATGITVSPFTALNGDNGLQFQGAFTDLPGNQGSDALLTYRVTDVTLGNTIIGANLTGVPTVLGGSGTVSATESFLPGNVNDTMSIFANSPGGSQLTTNLSFAGATSLNVQDSVLAFAVDGSPSLSFFTPTFHTTSAPIPEPASITLVGMAVATLAWRRVRRRKS
ncbi:MAG TPA: PEP-CTERM sorting domain-containing protein [Pirellulales bacterium]|nr:PEP-CTERM sorting domain-containing protein [Pirellulales bacterium]